MTPQQHQPAPISTTPPPPSAPVTPVVEETEPSVGIEADGSSPKKDRLEVILQKMTPEQMEAHKKTVQELTVALQNDGYIVFSASDAVAIRSMLTRHAIRGDQIVLATKGMLAGYTFTQMLKFIENARNTRDRLGGIKDPERDESSRSFPHAGWLPVARDALSWAQAMNALKEGVIDIPEPAFPQVGRQLGQSVALGLTQEQFNDVEELQRIRALLDARMAQLNNKSPNPAA